MGKPKRSGGEGELQRMLGNRASANRAKWARRHPDIAADERRLRKQRAGLVESWKHKNEGTAETHEHVSRHQEGALSKLYRTGAINSEQLAAAEHIAEISERIGRDVAVKTASLETRVDVTRHPDVGFFERLSQVRREMAYGEWRRSLRQPAPVLDMLTGDTLGFTIVARRYRMHNRRAKQLLIDALDLWIEILGSVHKQVDRGDLDAAHARLAA